MTKKSIKPWAAALLTGTMLVAAGAPAQATSPGPEWYLVSQQDFDTWQPNPPGPDWILVDQRDVDEWQPYPTAPSQGYWKLKEVRDRRYFLADGQYQRKLESSVKQHATDPDGVSDRYYGTDEIIKRTPGEEGTVIKKPYNVKVESGIRKLTQLVRYQRWEDQEYLRPWTRYFRFKDRTREVRTYRFEWKDPITNQTMREVDPNVEYTAWVYGAPYNKGIESQGKDPAQRRVSLPSEDREEVYYQIAVGASAVSNAKADRPTIFTGDSGSGSKTSLQGSKVRGTLGANQVKASEVTMTPEELEEAKRRADEEARRQAEEERQRLAEEEAKRKKEREETARKAQEAEEEPAGLTLAKVLGKWVSSGGKSTISIEQAEKSNTMKVTTNLVLGRETYAKTLNAVRFGKTWEGELGKDGLGAKIKLKATFSEDGKTMKVVVWRDGMFDVPIGEGTFTK